MTEKGWKKLAVFLQKDKKASLSKRQSFLLFNKAERLLTKELSFLHPNFYKAELIKELQTNEPYLSETIRKYTGKSINEYINDYRLDYALKLLISHEIKPIKKIAELSGFSSIRQFYRLFKKRIKITPTEYRKRRG